MTLLRPLNRASLVTCFVAIAVLLAAAPALRAQYQITTLGSTITENFDTYTSANGTAAPTFSNSLNVNTATNAAQRGSAWTYYTASNNGATVASNTTFQANDAGSSSTGGFRSYGATGTSDRALGFLGSGSFGPFNGVSTNTTNWVGAAAQFTNATGGIITSLVVTFAGEQWRQIASAASFITVGYSVASGSAAITNAITGPLSGTTFNAIGSTNILVNAVNTAPVNGDSSVFRNTTFTATINGLNIAAGGSINLAFAYAGGAGGGSRQGLAIDDLTITANGTAAAASLIWSGSSGDTWGTSAAQFASGGTTWNNTANASSKAEFATASQNITVGTIVAGGVKFSASGITLGGGSLADGSGSGLSVEVTNLGQTATVTTSLTSAGLTKLGLGTLVLGGTQSSLTGTITISGGTLQSDIATIGSKNITNSGTLEFTQSTDATYSGTLVNNGVFAKSGTGALTVGTSVTGSGGSTTITGGTLVAGADDAIVPSGALSMSAGTTLDLAGHTASASTLNLTGASITNVGTLSVSGAITTNADSTAATISGGTLALGSTTHTISVADGAASSDLTIASAITGTNTLTKGGAGTLTLTGNNTGFSGNVTLVTNTGSLALGNSNALGTGTLAFTGGTLQGNGTPLTLSNLVTMNGNGSIVGGSTDITFGGSWTQTATSTLTVNNTGNTTIAGTFSSSSAAAIRTLTVTGTGNLTISSVLPNNNTTGVGALTKSGTGNLTLSGANTYTGNTTITNGTLKLGASNVIADAVNVIINAIAGATATFDLDGNSDTFASLTFGGTSGTATSTSNLSTGAGTLTLGGNLTYDATNHPLGSTLSGKLDLGASRTFAIGDSTNAATDLAVSANISGTGFSLTKTGAGTLALSGTNSYSGGTTVSAGVIAANSSTALGTGVTTIDNTGTVAIPTAVKINSNFTVNSGGTLTGTGTAALGGIVNGPGGTLAGTLTFASGSSLAPGSSPGLLNITGAVTFASGSRYTWELGAFSTTTPGTNFDQVIIANGGSLSLLAGATLVPTFTGTATSPTAGNGFWTSAQTWTVVTNSGGTGTVTGTAFSIDNSAWSGSGNFATALSNNEVLLTWTPSAIPEPSTYAAIMGALALGATIWRRRHRHCR